jgi:hypothetical protein
MDVKWFVAAISGGIVVKILDYIVFEIRRNRESRETSKQLINRHLDPILKSADELVGKIRSLAQTDFVEFKKYQNRHTNCIDNMEITSFCYLFAQFWARVQILRIEGVYVNISSNDEGQKLKSFLDTLESKLVQIVDRANQRAIGESLINRNENGLSSLTYYEFLEIYKTDIHMQGIYKPLNNKIKQTHHTKNRQQLLIYGAVLHSLIDTLDPKNQVTKNRKGWPNKLSKKSQSILGYTIFNVYLPFISNSDKYISERYIKKRPPSFGPQ